MSETVQRAGQQSRSVVELAQELIRHPSRGGVDDYRPVLGALESWLAVRSVPHRRLRDAAGELVGLLVEVEGGRPGRWWALDACLDTAAFGDESAWAFSPTSGAVRDGWLLGRGAADSKLAASMFCHIAAELHQEAAELAGGLAVLLDVDEHTGGFGGALAYLADPRAARPAGVMIGYPGLDEVVVGGRGLWRAQVSVHATAGHSGSSRTVTGAISRAAHLVRLLDQAKLPGSPAAGAEFPLGPKVSVTAITGGQGFSVTPDRCELNIDVRTTPHFTSHDAEHLVRTAVTSLEAELPGPKPSEVTEVASWPPFRLREDQEPAAALFTAAHGAGLAVVAKVAGPSNIGNLLMREGVSSTAGFGVPYEGLHGINERASLAELPLVHAVYLQAVRSLLGAT
ncbi:M20 family metallopeptidase [Streptomyces sp. NPDC058659]|uniref:M20 family metallopeptidase n=1 Tax=Streptomyces sp. NPDC058659 TaxID=3346581 RepID=UPI003654C888